MIDAQRYSRRTYGNNASAAYTALADNLTLSSISMHYSTHADNIAVTHSIIDFQYIFLLLISGAVSSLLRLRTAYSQLRKCAYSNIIPVGSCSVVSQRSGRSVSLATVDIMPNVEIDPPSGENVEWHWVGGASLSPKKYRPLAKAGIHLPLQYA